MRNKKNRQNKKKGYRQRSLVRFLRASILAIAIVVLVLGLIKVREAGYRLPSANPYDISDFFAKDGRIHYQSVSRAETVIDVSSHNGQIDWDRVAKDGVDGAIIRLGYRGHTHNNIAIDQRAIENLRGAKKAGLKIGGYFFSQAATEKEAVEEADFCFKVLAGLRLDYPLAYDMEEVNNSYSPVPIMTKEERSKCADAFCRRVDRKGYESMVYGNKRWLETMIKLDELSCKNIWYAQYNPYPDFQWEYAIWQYTETGQVRGVKGNVDINLWMK